VTVLPSCIFMQALQAFQYTPNSFRNFSTYKTYCNTSPRKHCSKSPSQNQHQTSALRKASLCKLRPPQSSAVWGRGCGPPRSPRPHLRAAILGPAAGGAAPPTSVAGHAVAPLQASPCPSECQAVLYDRIQISPISGPFGNSMSAAARPERWGVSRATKG